ncbi:hypothetical protein [Thermosphaera aggregans]|jgi:hypothetical protein|uniref:Uncharacterized protein n=1 Tax=Thermosphaera aggregans (strain DSM 11486 / M11TL) TaxID=633148 RepID=D5U0I6_THEAM|nr:hypothetical protein [Thermosphaera aggregans]ADG90636.1 hypothetical protein Tagg_0361 [Thermosphaera aggregans DSM 11486]
MSEALEITERVLKAFKYYRCFVFEKHELPTVKDFVVKSELTGLVIIKKVDPKYEDIYILTASIKGFEQECISKVDELLSRGQIPLDQYKKMRNELVEQCITSMEHERVKEIIGKIEKYYQKLRRI